MADLRKPDERECERCGRREVWDDDHDTWRVPDREDASAVGDVHCVHEWDIDGSFRPIE
ncbi:HEWD family protein [Halorubellus sp. PRR65]|uniref:HEWD family protein n=1 Tax=Halorubellus sp. PRR65 TaxID=3098148 RepID=UPI002B25721E|nr:HEWD family protein [Halorubellus sp. PRR65]